MSQPSAARSSLSHTHTDCPACTQMCGIYTAWLASDALKKSSSLLQFHSERSKRSSTRFSFNTNIMDWKLRLFKKVELKEENIVIIKLKHIFLVFSLSFNSPSPHFCRASPCCSFIMEELPCCVLAELEKRNIEVREMGEGVVMLRDVDHLLPPCKCFN